MQKVEEHVSARAVCVTARVKTNGTRRFLNIFGVGLAREKVSARLEVRRKVRFGDTEIPLTPRGFVCIRGRSDKGPVGAPRGCVSTLRV